MADATANDPTTPGATGGFDLASRDDQDRVRRLADTLLAEEASSESIRGIGADSNQPLDLRIASKLALSKRSVEHLDWSGRIAIVFAMWGEHRRLRPRSSENPTGEDALHVKLDQLDWLFTESSVDWRLYPVDDGDPENSAAVAEKRAATHPTGARVKVLRLADVLPAAGGPLESLESADDSRKGGAIVYGASVALADGCDAVVMTDADNSVNLSTLR